MILLTNAYWLASSIYSSVKGVFLFPIMSRFTDYAYKAHVLQWYPDLIKKQHECSLYDYALKQYNENGIITYSMRHAKSDSMSSSDFFEYCFNNFYLREFYECVRINKAYANRLTRLYGRVASMLNNGSCLFLTLTFNDKALGETTEKQRRNAVSRFLKQYNAQYVANVDYGAQNGREHYHALINCSRVDCSSWSLGAVNFEKVRHVPTTISTKTKLSKYIAKLTNHAIKATTRRSALMYSR